MEEKDFRQAVKLYRRAPVTLVAPETGSLVSPPEKDVTIREKARVWFPRNLPRCALRMKSAQNEDEALLQDAQYALFKSYMQAFAAKPAYPRPVVPLASDQALPVAAADSAVTRAGAARDDVSAVSESMLESAADRVADAVEPADAQAAVEVADDAAIQSDDEAVSQVEAAITAASEVQSAPETVAALSAVTTPEGEVPVAGAVSMMATTDVVAESDDMPEPGMPEQPPGWRASEQVETLALPENGIEPELIASPVALAVTEERALANAEAVAAPDPMAGQTAIAEAAGEAFAVAAGSTDETMQSAGHAIDAPESLAGQTAIVEAAGEAFAVAAGSTDETRQSAGHVADVLPAEAAGAVAVADLRPPSEDMADDAGTSREAVVTHAEATAAVPAEPVSAEDAAADDALTQAPPFFESDCFAEVMDDTEVGMPLSPAWDAADEADAVVAEEITVSLSPLVAPLVLSGETTGQSLSLSVDKVAMAGESSALSPVETAGSADAADVAAAAVDAVAVEGSAVAGDQSVSVLPLPPAEAALPPVETGMPPGPAADENDEEAAWHALVVTVDEAVDGAVSVEAVAPAVVLTAAAGVNDMPTVGPEVEATAASAAAERQNDALEVAQDLVPDGDKPEGISTETLGESLTALPDAGATVWQDAPGSETDASDTAAELAWPAADTPAQAAAQLTGNEASESLLPPDEEAPSEAVIAEANAVLSAVMDSAASPLKTATVLPPAERERNDEAATAQDEAVSVPDEMAAVAVATAPAEATAGTAAGAIMPALPEAVAQAHAERNNVSMAEVSPALTMSNEDSVLHPGSGLAGTEQAAGLNPVPARASKMLFEPESNEEAMVEMNKPHTAPGKPGQVPDGLNAQDASRPDSDMDYPAQAFPDDVAAYEAAAAYGSHSDPLFPPDHETAAANGQHAFDEVLASMEEELTQMLSVKPIPPAWQAADDGAGDVAKAAVEEAVDEDVATPEADTVESTVEAAVLNTLASDEAAAWAEEKAAATLAAEPETMIPLDAEMPVPATALDLKLDADADLPAVLPDPGETAPALALETVEEDKTVENSALPVDDAPAEPRSASEVALMEKLAAAWAEAGELAGSQQVQAANEPAMAKPAVSTPAARLPTADPAASGASTQPGTAGKRPDAQASPAQAVPGSQAQAAPVPAAGQPGAAAPSAHPAQADASSRIGRPAGKVHPPQKTPDAETALADGLRLAEGDIEDGGETMPSTFAKDLPVLREVADGTSQVPEEALFRRKLWNHQRTKMAYSEYKVALAYARQNTDASRKEMVKWYMRAAENGHAVSQFNLGNIFYSGRGVVQDFRQAAKWFEMAAQQGVARAQDSLGLLHLHGRGVEKNEEKAVYWFSQAAKQGYAPAQFKLAAQLETGSGIRANLQEAMLWYVKAAMQGDSHAEKALSRLKKLAGKG